VIALLQAMAKARPIIPTRRIRFLDHARDGQTGRRSAPGGVNGSEAAIRLQGKTPPRERIGRGSHRWIEPLRRSRAGPRPF